MWPNQTTVDIPKFLPLYQRLSPEETLSPSLPQATLACAGVSQDLQHPGTPPVASQERKHQEIPANTRKIQETPGNIMLNVLVSARICSIQGIAPVFSQERKHLGMKHCLLYHTVICLGWPTVAMGTMLPNTFKWWGKNEGREQIPSAYYA